MYRKDKKGQAAMEFLMTYGWAILAAIIVIGILGYYYFSTDVISPKGSIVSAPFYLNAVSVNTSTVSLELKNNGGETYSVSDVTVANCGSYTTATDIAAGEMAVVPVDCNETLTAGETFDGSLTVTYTKSGSSLPQTSTGSVKQPIA